jgi:cyclic pyranopterin phosphate synthase
LKRVNLHIDTLNPDRLRKVMRFASLDAILAGIEAVERAGITPVKINCVVVRDHNDRDVAHLARFALERDWHVRFIELMPLGGGECAQLSLSQFVPSDETKALLESELGPLTPLTPCNASDESRNYRAEGLTGVIGFISPVSDPYCGACNRMRLTADGRFHLCLLNDDEIDVRSALRNGGGDQAIREILSQAVAGKPTGHQLDAGISTEQRSMFQIGG